MQLFNCLVVTLKFRMTLGRWLLLCYNSPLEEVEGKEKKSLKQVLLAWIYLIIQWSCPSQGTWRPSPSQVYGWNIGALGQVVTTLHCSFLSSKIEKRYLQHCPRIISFKCESVLWTMKYCTDSQKRISFPIYSLIQSGWSTEWTYYLKLESPINYHLWQRNWRCKNKLCIKSSHTWSEAHFLFTQFF